MMPLAQSAELTQSAIQRFLDSSKQPALLEPGEPVMPLAGGNFMVEARNARITIQAWNDSRNLVRRVTGVLEESRGRLELAIERFARKPGRLFLIDLAKPVSRDWHQRGERLVFRERFRRFLTRQFAGWKVAEISAEPNLEHSLSPVFPRAYLKKGASGWAAIAAAPETHDSSAILSFGLIWLDYLRRREQNTTMHGLALFLPHGEERTTCLRLAFLNPAAARYEIFAYNDDDFIVSIDARDFGNLDTGLEPCRRPDPATCAAVESLPVNAGAEQVDKGDGSISLRVRGLEFARAAAGRVTFGLKERSTLREGNHAEFERLANELARMRSPRAEPASALYLLAPEAWLESQVRAGIETLDASLLRHPIYGQVPAFAGGDRGLIDLLAVDLYGRLAVIELKASADLHLPLQALDYWLRVKWHLDRGHFDAQGYFPGVELRRETPRLLLISPSLEFHPATETILSYFSPSLDVERIGLAVEWRKRLTVMFHLRDAQQPF